MRQFSIVSVVSVVCAAMLLSAVPAAAQAKDPYDVAFDAAYGILHDSSETSGVGAHVGVSKKVWRQDKLNAQVAGEIGFNHFSGATLSDFLAGIVVAGDATPMVAPFAQFLLGGEHNPAETDFAIQPGFGVDVGVKPSANWKLRLEFDIRHVSVAGFGYTEERFAIGVVLPLSK